MSESKEEEKKEKINSINNISLSNIEAKEYLSSSMYIRVAEDENSSFSFSSSSAANGGVTEREREENGDFNAAQNGGLNTYNNTASQEILPSNDVTLQIALRHENNNNNEEASLSSSLRRVQYCQWFVFAICTSFIIVLTISYKNNWNLLCDVNVKMWSLVWLIRWNLQIITIMLITYLKLRQITIPFLLSIVVRLNHIFGFSWWIFGIDVLFFQNKCNYSTLANIVSKIMFWSTAVLYMFPFFLYFLVCLCLPCIIYFFAWFAVPSADRQPTPNSVVERLEVKTYREIVEALKRQYNVSESGVLRSSGISHLSFGEVIGNVSSMLGSAALSASNISQSAHSLIAHSIQNSNTQNNMIYNMLEENKEDLEKKAECEKADENIQLRNAATACSYSTMNAASVPQQIACATNNISAEEKTKAESITINKSCPICIVDMDMEDEVMIMPCDNRHFFHKTCVIHWLETSQVCPICRDNIVHRVTGTTDNDEQQHGLNEA